jgi:hypothetical protein
VIPPHNFAVSSLPPITGVRHGVGVGVTSGVGVALGKLGGSSRCKVERRRSSEIQRNTIAAKSPRKSTRASQPNVLRRNLRTSRLPADPGDNREGDPENAKK